MAWVMLWFLIIAFSCGFATFLYLIIWDKGTAAQQVSVGGLDGLLGWAMKTVVTYLFPTNKQVS
jgi:hypothetical protein